MKEIEMEDTFGVVAGQGEELETVDQGKVLESVLAEIPYSFTKDVLIKPLAPIKVQKEVIKHKPNGKRDENGFEEYDVEKTMEEVEATFREGIVLRMPVDLQNRPYNVGDTVVFPIKAAGYFDLYRDSMLVRDYDIVAVRPSKTA